MLREKSCGALVVRRDEEDGKQYLLMIRHKLGGHRSFPKGHMEPGETEYMTAVREVFEETAVQIRIDCKFRENLLGHAEVRQTIHVPNVGTIAGSYIQDGKVTRQSQIRVVRDGVVIFEDKISSLKRFKDDAREVASGYECGIGLEKFNDIKVGDILEAFIMEQIEQ